MPQASSLQPHTLRRLRLGTRASALARWQAEWVAAELRRQGIDVEVVLIATSGDQQQTPIGAVSGRGVFTKEIQRELLEGRVDLAVHSMKDLPTDEVPGLALAAVPPRAPVEDALISREQLPLHELPVHAVVGTGSLRRRAQLLRVRPDLAMKDIRGNVDTRLRKLDQGEYDAVVLAQAGLQRLGLAERITQALPLSTMLPAVGQGALGIETRSDDPAALQAVAVLDDPLTHTAVLAERALLASLEGGCLAPIAAWGRIENGRLVLSGRVISPDGSQMLEASLTMLPTEARPLGRRVAESLLDQGAAQLIQAAREP